MVHWGRLARYLRRCRGKAPPAASSLHGTRSIPLMKLIPRRLWFVSSVALLLLAVLASAPLLTTWLAPTALAQEKPKANQAADDENPFPRRIDVPDFPKRLEW